MADLVDHVGFAGAFTSYQNALHDYAANPSDAAAQSQLVTSAAALGAAAASVVSDNPVIKNAAGAVSVGTNLNSLQNDIDAYNDAVARNDSAAQTQAVLGITGDAAGAGAGVSAIAIAAGLELPPPVGEAVTLVQIANALTFVATGASLAQRAAQMGQDYREGMRALDRALSQGAFEEDEDLHEMGFGQSSLEDPADSQPGGIALASLGIGLAPFARLFSAPPNPRDPLVLDLSGTGIQLTSVDGSSAHFDFAGSGFAAQSGWVTPSEGLLVTPSSHGGYQLVGAQSGDGFADLAQLDSNNDGVINASDPAFANLDVWIDANGNGTMDSGEVVSLNSLGITSVNLAANLSGQQINGNTVVSTSSFTTAGPGGVGSVTRTIAEVDFATNGLDSRFTPPAGFSYIPAPLPQLVGYGDVPSLSIAMALNPTLLAEVQNLVADAGAVSGAAFDAAFQAMVAQWVGASDIDPASRGSFVNAQHLAVVYAFYGIDAATQPAYQVDPNAHSGGQWEAIYQTIISELEVRFASQVPLAQLLNGVSWSTVESNAMLPFAAINFDAVRDTVSVDFNDLIHSIVQAAPSDPAAASVYYDQTFTIVRYLVVDLFNGNNRTMAAAFAVAAEQAGMPRDIEATFFSSIGLFTIDEGATTGTISNQSFNAVVFVGTGDKTLSSGDFNNILVYSSTDGNDTITRGSTGWLALTDIASTAVIFERPDDGNDLLIVNKNTGTILTIAGQYAGEALQGITFADGVSLDFAGVQATLQSEAIESIIADVANGASFAQEQADLAELGFISAIDGTGATSLQGTGGNDVIFLAAGDKTARGGGGSDIYVYASADGNDVIADGGSHSQIVFGDINASDVAVSRSGSSDDLVLTVISTGKTITVQGQFNYLAAGTLQTFTFADGTAWTAAQVKQMLLAQGAAQSGGSIYGFDNSSDTLVAGLGDKYLNGLGGADTYIYASADGNDVINDGGSHSVIAFSDINASGVTLSRTGSSDDLVITVNATGKTITIKGQFNYLADGTLQTFTFADGIVWTAQQVKQMLLDQGAAQTGGSIYGYANSNDTLVAGLGDKYLNGLGGADAYVYASADGNDVINDGGNHSAIAFSDINASDVTLSRAGSSDDLVITVNATGKTITIKGQFNYLADGTLQTFTFADGTVWSAQQVKQMLLDQGTAQTGGSIYGFDSSSDTLVAGLGDKYLNGLGGADTYVYASADGNDVINDGGNRSVIAFSDINASGVTLSRVGSSDDLVITVNATGKTITIKGQFNYLADGTLQTFTFADGTAWTAQQVKQMLLNQETAQASGSIYGYANSSETLVAGAGNKYLDGLGGSDTYVYSSTGGNDIIDDGSNHSALTFSDINASGVTLSRVGASDDLVITVNATGKTVTVKGQFNYLAAGTLQTFTFADGTVWTAQQVKQMLLNQESAQVSGSIYGYANSSDTLVAGLGNKYLNGEGGADTYVYVSADGNDVIDDGASSSRLVLSDIASTNVSLAVSTQNNNDLIVTIKSTGKTITVKGQFNFFHSGQLQSFTFSDGVTWTAAQIQQLTGPALVIAGTGDKTLNGNGQALTYVYSSAGGNDIINDGSHYKSKLLFLDINSTDVAMSRNGSSRDLLISVLTMGKTVTVQGEFDRLGNGSLVSVSFADGTVWTTDQVKQILLAQEAATPSGSIYGYIDSNDTLYAGVGTKYLSGLGGADTYVYSTTAGNDTIDDGQFYKGSLVFSDINSTAVALNRVGTSRDLTITDTVTGQVLTIAGQFDVNGNGALTSFTFANGTVWTATQIKQMLLAQEAAAPSGSIYGYSDSHDTLYAGVGTKYLNGLGGGGDTYVYSTTAGNDTIDDGGFYHSSLIFSDINSTDVGLNRVGNSRDLIVTDTVTGQVLTIAGQFDRNGNGALTSFTFANGTVWTSTQIKQMLLAQEAAAPSGSIYGYSDSNDTLNAGVGNKYMSGLGGTDTYVYASTAGNDTIDDGQFHRSLLTFSDINVADLALNYGSTTRDLVMTDLINGHTLTITGEFDVNGNGTLASFTFANGTVWTAAQALALKLGTTGNDTLTGTSGNDTIYGSPGTDTLNGGGGADTYRIGSNIGHTTINNTDPHGATTASGEVDFGSGLSSQNLWFLQSGNDLQIDILGTTKELTVAGWYGANGSAQVQSFTTADGMKVDGQLSQLVSAMATYSANNSGFNPTTATQMPTDSTLQGAVAAAWHH